MTTILRSGLPPTARIAEIAAATKARDKLTTVSVVARFLNRVDVLPRLSFRGPKTILDVPGSRLVLGLNPPHCV